MKSAAIKAVFLIVVLFFMTTNFASAINLLKTHLFKNSLATTASVFKDKIPGQSDIAKLPVPEGPNAIGTRIINLKDNSRFDTIQKSARYITLQLWYPCEKLSSKPLADYIPDKIFVDSLVRAKYYNQDSTTLSNFYHLKTHSILNAKLLKSKSKFPVLFFSPGMGVARANYTNICEELASRGIVMIMVDHIYETTTMLPNERIANPSQDRDSTLNTMITNCVKDLSFVTDQIYNRKPALRAFVGDYIDQGRIGACGHSLGGNIAMEATIADNRIKYSVNLDGGFFDHLKGKHINSQCLMIRESPIYSDEELKKKGRTRTGLEKRAGQFNRIVDTLLEGTKHPCYSFKIEGTGHFSFSDAPYLMPGLLTMFGGKIIDKDRSRIILSDCISAFVKSSSNKISEGLVSKIKSYPEIDGLKLY